MQKKNTTKHRLKDIRGFSLVELIIVISIMVVLLSVLAPTLIGCIERSRTASDGAMIDEIKNAMEVLAADPDASLDADIVVTQTISEEGDGYHGGFILTAEGDGDMEKIQALIGTSMDDNGNVVVDDSSFQSRSYTNAYPHMEIRLTDLDEDGVHSGVWRVEFRAEAGGEVIPWETVNNLSN